MNNIFCSVPYVIYSHISAQKYSYVYNMCVIIFNDCEKLPITDCNYEHLHPFKVKLKYCDHLDIQQRKIPV